MAYTAKELKLDVKKWSPTGSTLAGLWSVTNMNFISLSVLKLWPAQLLKYTELANSTVYHMCVLYILVLKTKK